MRSPTLSAVLPLTLLGCTFNTYSTSTLPPGGFGMQAAPAGAMAHAHGGEVGAGNARETEPGGTRQRTWHSRAGRPVAHADAGTKVATGGGGRGPSAAESRRDEGKARERLEAPAEPAGESSRRRSGSAATTTATTTTSTTSATAATATSATTSASAPPRGARPDGGVVVLARGTSSARGDARAARLRERSARGLGPRPRHPKQPSSRAAAVLKAARDPDRAQSRPSSESNHDASGTAKLHDSGTAKLEDAHPSASGTAKLAASGDDASATAVLARAERTEHTHRSEERESLATK